MSFLTLCVLFAVIGLAVASGITDANNVNFYDSETNEYLGPFVRDNSSSSMVYKVDTSQPCKCAGGDCKCCTGLQIKRLNVRQETCSRILYDPSKRMLDVSLIYNNRKIAESRYSVDGPSPLCAPLPLPPPFTGLIKICLQLYDINVSGPNLHACVDIQTHILDADTPVLVLHFNCFTVGLNGIQYQQNKRQIQNKLVGK